MKIAFLSVIILFGVVVCESTIQDYRMAWPWDILFRDNKGFDRVTHGATTEKAKGMNVLAVGDVNGDKTIDLISVSDDGLTFNVHYYIKKDDAYTSVEFEQTACIITDLYYVPATYQIMVVCGEYTNYDSLMMIQIYKEDDKDELPSKFDSKHLIH